MEPKENLNKGIKEPKKDLNDEDKEPKENLNYDLKEDLKNHHKPRALSIVGSTLRWGSLLDMSGPGRGEPLPGLSSYQAKNEDLDEDLTKTDPGPREDLIGDLKKTKDRA